MDWLWVVIPGFLVAVATVLDGRHFTPYFAWTELIFDYTRVVQSGRRAVLSTVSRRLLYPFLAGFVLVIPLHRSQGEAVGAGALAIAVILWPVFVSGLPTHLTDGKRGKLLFFYASLILLYAFASWVGSFAAQAIGSANGLWVFLRDQAISGVFWFTVAAFGSFGFYRGTKPDDSDPGASNQ